MNLLFIYWLWGLIVSYVCGYTICFYIIHCYLQIWDEVGETDEERDQMLLQLEQECLDVYKRKVDQAAKSRAYLLQTLADANIELARLLAALGEKTVIGFVSNHPSLCKISSLAYFQFLVFHFSFHW